MTFSIRVTGGGNLALAIQQYKALQKRLTDRRDPLLAATRAVAAAWGANYTSEGVSVGGWAELSDRSLKERAAQGFGAGPILRRSGTLQNAAVADFTSALDSFSNSAFNPYRQGPAAAIYSQLSLSDERASLSLSGYPASVNQSGDVGRGIPARPIWYVDEAVKAQASAAVEAWLSELTKEFTL